MSDSQNTTDATWALRGLVAVLGDIARRRAAVTADTPKQN